MDAGSLFNPIQHHYSRMICQGFLPSLSLRPFIKDYQLRYFTFTDKTGPTYKPYAPRPEQTLAFFPRGYEQVEYVDSGQFINRPPSALIGQQIGRINRHLQGEEFCTILVNLHPGVLHRFVGIPFHELTNTFIDAEAIFPPEIRRVNQRLSSVQQPTEMIAVIDAYLLHLFKSMKNDTHPIELVANRLIEYPEDSSMLQLAASSCFSVRQFERRFKERMGVSPKFFTRVARLTKAFGMKYNQPTLDWLSVALYCGYYDYQHLAKDFVELAGRTPKAYLLEDATQAPERQLGLQDSSLTGEKVAFLPLTQAQSVSSLG
ncbi:AraC family transcriptional regulator [Spirosoma sp. BT702]|uniref:AraC family transcriptional regulator n=1 Tax=Spirosoma profusum TaxID=2771354 RepID=A0A927AWK2_9BACT|nr:helix-turn-helix domain-containing protein [Spirosoma profusum]MBD2705694.1 AraC family transcriptional regulator [Spirosoma profusum]